ncbi:MAG: FAD-binding oxidoreductase [Gammaproteobacteria bacterium]|nr:FAD-binding oxidoreductase [Gammaproteobacteria bacterium]
MDKESQIAVDLFKQVIGAENVITDDRILDLQITTFATGVKIKGALYPGTREEVQECVKIADAHQIKLYPISRGKNIGLGAQVPNTDDCMIFNLSRLNRILDFNEDLAYISVEPGVTQEQVSVFLSKQKSTLMLSVTGSFPESSIIGNAAERGDTTGPYIERCEYVCNLGVVMANGDYIKTGAGLYQNSKIQHVTKWGLGPDLAGLFIQSNLGIITDLTLWLSPIPEDKDGILFTLNSEAQLEEVCDILRSLKLRDVIADVSLRNDFKIAATVGKYPWQEVDEKNSLDQWMVKWRKKYFLGKWNGLIVLRSSSKAVNRARKKEVYKALAGKVSYLIAITDFKFKLLTHFRVLLQFVSRINFGAIVSIKEMFGSQGKPGYISAKSLYWRKRLSKEAKPNLASPEKDKVGFIWCSVNVPSVGSDVVKAVQIAEKTIQQYQFEPNLCILYSTGKRAVMIPCAITYDREVPGEDEKAMQCYEALLKQFMEAGYYPNRLGIQSMDAIPKSNYANESVVARLKKALDPNDIIAPGRYDFRHHWP